jgi:transposase-like protein
VPSSCLSHDCRSDKIGQLRGAKLFRCLKCQREYTVTRGTIFFRTKQPIRRWFIFIWLFYSYRLFARSGDISIQLLAEQFRVRYSSVWNMIDAIRSNADGLSVYQELYFSLNSIVLPQEDLSLLED